MGNESDHDRHLENYEIVRKIGRGKYAEVFEGIQVQTLQKVVIKALKPSKYEINKFARKKLSEKSKY